MSNPPPCSDAAGNRDPLTELEAGQTDYQRETRRVTVDQHAAFQEHCRDTLAEIQRIEREADLLSLANREGIK